MKIDLNWTTSKVLAYIIVAISSTYAFVNKDVNALQYGFLAAGTVIAVKTYTQKGENDAKVDN